MMKQMLGLRLLIDPVFLGSLQQAVSADNIRVDKGIGACYRSVNMALCGEVNEGIDLVFVQKRFDQLLITDRAVHERRTSLALTGLLGCFCYPHR